MTWTSDKYRGRWYLLEEFYEENIMPTNYSLWKSIGKTIIRLVLVAIPFIVAHFPNLMSLTVGGVLMVGFDALKSKYSTL